ncbi:MAG: nucleoside hydrolase [Limisphaerales bacterium]
MTHARLLACLLLTVLGLSAPGAPRGIIFDTDITGDVDDVLALAMLHSLTDRGACELKAVTISKKNVLAAPFVDAVNTFYGRPNLPIGVSVNAPHRDSKYLHLIKDRNAYPHDLKQAENAVSLLRRVLAASEERSVAIVQVGLAVNIADLIDSKPDQYSPLSGIELIRKKVHHLSVMAGAFETIRGNNHYLEANVRNHVPSMQKLASEWPAEVSIIWSGFEIGIAAAYPRESIAKDFEYVPQHIVKEAYLLHSGPNHDRPTWDLTSVLYSVYPDRGYFDLSFPGRVTVADDGYTRFDSAATWRGDAKAVERAPAHRKRDRFLKMSPSQATRVKEALVHLVAQPPRKK